MRKIKFPSPQEADGDGLVAVGGDLEVDMLYEAYSKGIFPWPISPEFPIAWFSPNPRGIIDLKDWHEPLSFKKFEKKTKYKVTYNQDFYNVIKQCAMAKRKNQPSTWITPAIIEGYYQFFLAGFAYSIEVWDEDELIGGLYGVKIKKFVSGESMFSLKNNASKCALKFLIHKMKSEKIDWLDTQMVSPVVKLFGGKEISRDEFLLRIQSSFKDS